MGSIVEWQALKMQEYRWWLLDMLSHFFALFGMRRTLHPASEFPPVDAGDYDHALHVDHPEAPSFLDKYMNQPQPPAVDKPAHGD
jgi:hypothetical protein